MLKKESRQKDTTEVVLRYKNVHYSDNISSVHSIYTPLSFECFKNNCQNNDNSCDQPRPISCPVCAKMIAMKSILVHFYFDHSKVPKLRLTSLKRQHIVIKAADLSFETKCIAVLLIEEKWSSTGNLEPNPIQTNKIRPFLLLATKMRIESSSKSMVCVTEKKCIEEKHSQSQLVKHRFDKNENLLFWTCKIDNHELISNVKLSRKDKKMSFSYTGDSVHIKDKQDASNMYRHAECLIIRGTAANNLIDTHDQMNVFVRYLR